MIRRFAFHVHSEWSYDATWPIERLAKYMQVRGYDGILLSEHDRGFTEERRKVHREECARASSANFCVLPGIEYSDSTNTVHILTWGDVPFLGENCEPMEILERVSAAGGVAVLAHPSRKGAWRLISQEWTPHLSGIEQWNRKTDGWAPSSEATHILTQVSLPAYAGLDFHSPKQRFPLAMMIRLAAMEDLCIIDAMRRRLAMAEAFRQPLSRSCQGLPALALRTLELMRRRAAKLRRMAFC